MDSTGRANNVIDDIKSGTRALNLIKKNVEEFLLEKNGQSRIAKSQFAIRCLNALATSIKLQNGTSKIESGSLRLFVTVVVLCHDYVFNRGHDCTEEEESQIGCCLYNILFKIIEKDYKEGVIISDLIVKSFSRSYSISPKAHVGSIVRNASILLWNASLKSERSPAEALRLRLISLTHLSLSGDPKCAIKFCDRALTSAQLYCSALDREGGNEVRDLGQFTDDVLSMFRYRLVASLDGSEADLPGAFENIVKLIHLNVSRHLKHDCFEKISEFLVTARKLYDTFQKIIKKFSSCTGAVLFGFEVLDFALLLTSITSRKPTVPTKDKVLGRIEGLRTDDFTQFDKNCFAVGVTSLRIHFRMLVDKARTDASVIHALVPWFRQIAEWITSSAQSASSGDSIYLLDHLAFYQLHHLKVVQYADEKGLKTDLGVVMNSLECYDACLALAKNRSELIQTFVRRIFHVAFVPQERKMYAEVVDILHPYVTVFVESFVLAEKISKEIFWKEMTTLVHCMKKISKFDEALNLVALFLSKGHVEMDAKAVALWADVKQEARLKKVDSVRAVTIPKLVAPLFTGTHSYCKPRMASLLAKEVAVLRGQSCPVEDFYAVLCDLLDFTDDSVQMASALIQMARLLLGNDLQCNAEGRTASECCRQALDLLGDGVSTDRRCRPSNVRWFVVQAKFICYLDRLRQVYDVLDGKVARKRAQQAQSAQNQREVTERMNAAAAAAEADGDVSQNKEEFFSFQPSNISEELESVMELDACLASWTAMINNGQPEVTEFSSVLLGDLKLAAEICSNARLFEREIAVRELYVEVAKQQKMRTEHMQGSSQLACTLARLGFVDAAERVLQAVDSCGGTDRSKELATQASISLQLAHSELCLMQDRLMDGVNHLASAGRLLAAEKHYKAVMLLQGRTLLLLGKYTEIPSPSNDTFGPLKWTFDALRYFVGILKTCAKEKDTWVKSINVELIGCLLDCGFQTSLLFYDVGLPRDACCYLKVFRTMLKTIFFGVIQQSKLI